MIQHLGSFARNSIVAFGIISLAGCAATSGGSSGSEASDEAVLAESAANVIETQLAQPASERIPSDLLASAQCIAVFPSVVKAGFVVGAKRGSGLVSCRQGSSAEWSDTVPAFFNITGASVGLQAGVQSTQLILLIMNETGVDQLLSGSVTLGSDIGVVAGPVGRNINLQSAKAPVVAYARSAGLFLGIDLGGSTIGYDGSANADVYGPVYDEADQARELLFGSNQVPTDIEVYTDALSDLTSQ